MYENELKILSELNLDNIRKKTMESKEKILSKQISELSQIIVQQINLRSSEGKNFIDMDIDGYERETAKIILKELKKKWKAKIYIRGDRYGYYNWLKVKW